MNPLATALVGTGALLVGFGAALAPRLRRAALRRRMEARHRAAEGPWRAARDAYAADPDALATCVHLQPVERALRRAGIPVEYRDVRRVDAPALVDEARLRAAFSLADPVAYAEPRMDGRAAGDPRTALLVCRACDSVLGLRHADEATPDTPRFPPETSP